MFIEIGNGWHINLAHVAKVHVVDQGGIGTTLKLYSLTNDHLGDFNPSSPEELMRVLNLIHSYGKTPTPEIGTLTILG
ncbi:hypothetical protein RY831_20885 [Noviherbaspirillum sp. CPCC 100848]|uniref:Uncharacterized protein n=1 Tax=Noviherbaspirillum album TaxID=3080276 RepID=A0ABU6JDB4_9BURK|nr:hypothetical protein [Noviherbaspirillum sp. CPCC 100848]MEC4721627.1 hypothetical protein [Noviherbaspirillum sp. CPCC 100848]